jgi:acetyl-CoA synthetase
MATKAAGGGTPIEALLKEKRKFTPPKEFAKRANARSASIYAQAAKNPVRFWEGFARELDWFKPWKKALEWAPHQVVRGRQAQRLLQLPRPPH